MQQVSIRNKWISLRGGSYVKDVNEQDVFYVKGKFWTVTRKKFVQDMQGNLLYTVRNKFWTFFVKKAMVYDKDGNQVAFIRKKFWSVHDRYFVKSSLGDLEITGNILGFNYHIILDIDKSAGCRSDLPVIFCRAKFPDPELPRVEQLAGPGMFRQKALLAHRGVDDHFLHLAGKELF